MAESALKKWNKGLVGAGNFTSHFLLLIIRLYWGVHFITSGFLKWQELDSMTSAFGNIGIPFPAVMVIVVGFFEIVGGISWILGLFTRLFSIPLIAICIVAYLTVFLNQLTGIFNDPLAFTAATPFLFLFASLTLFCFGAGYISLDYKMALPSKKGK